MTNEQKIFDLLGRLVLYVGGVVSCCYVLDIPTHAPSFKWVVFMLLYVPLALRMLVPDLFNRE